MKLRSHRFSMRTKLPYHLFYEEDFKWPFPVQASIQLPCFSIKYSRLAMFLSTLLWYFDFVLGRRFILFSQLEFSLRRLPSIWLTGEHSDPNGTIHTQAFGLLKKATCPCRQFLVAPIPISSLFLYPCTPLLRCVPNQNHDATQVVY